MQISNSKTPLALIAALLLPVVAHAAQVQVTIESEYGADKVTPRTGTISVEETTEQTFDAPEFVYLNRDFVELDALGAANDPDESKIAYYRARNIGYAIDGELVQGAERFFKKTITEATTIVWKWELEYAVFVESEHSAGAPLPGDGVGLGEPLPPVGRTWVVKDTEFSASVKRFVAGDSDGRRYAAADYTLENIEQDAAAVVDDDYYWAFREAGGGTLPIDGLDLPNVQTATIAWWGKIDRKLDSGRDQVFFSLADGTARHSDPMAEFGGEVRLLNSMTCGVRADGQFFVEEISEITNPLAGAPNYRYEELATLPSRLVGLQWHHWAVVFDSVRNPVANISVPTLRIYRDSVLVLEKNLSFRFILAPPVLLSGDTDRIRPGYTTFRTAPGGSLIFDKLEGGLNNFSYFPRAATQQELLENALWSNRGTLDYVSGTTAPLDFEGEPPAVGDGVTRESFPDQARSALRTDSSPQPLSEVGDRVFSQTVTITDWLRLRWRWDEQVRYRFGASSGAGGAVQADFNGHAFARYYDATGLAVEKEMFASGSFTDLWVPVGRGVETGSFYRTFNRCFTLGDIFPAPDGDLTDIGAEISAYADAEVADTENRVRVARIADMVASTPTTVFFSYEPTTFRAEVPLGEGFDALNPDVYLTPALCDGAVLRTGASGPNPGFTPVGSPVTGIATPSSDPLRWDQVSSKLYPVQPGSNLFEWRDADDPSKVYRFELVSGYPNSTVPLTSPREAADGSRLGSAPDYITSAVLPGTDPRFPAAPGSHYRHQFGPSAAQSPPTSLDLDANDNWHLVGQTYTDRSAGAQADTDSPGAPFTSRAGKSVLLYTFRSDPDTVADGSDPSVESLAVRVVESTPISAIAPASDANPLGLGGMLLGAGDTGVVARVSSPAQLRLEGDFAIEFWLNTKGLLASDDPISILSTGPGKLEIVLDPAAATITASYFGLTAQHPVSTAGSGWTHYVMHVFAESFLFVPLTILDFYSDGQRREDGVLTSAMPAGYGSDFAAGPAFDPNGLVLGVGASPESELLIDGLRMFDSIPDTPGSYLREGDIRALRGSRSAILRGKIPLLRFDFETAPTDPGTGVASYASSGLLTAFGLGPASGSGADNSWVRLGTQEVARRIYSALDAAGFGGGGYILNEVSNYNVNLYNRSADVGSWGAIFPVNDKRLFTDSTRKLEVAYYENPFRQDLLSHPNVAWPYVAASYDEVLYPSIGPDRDKAIYIASRLGSEGIDQNGVLQPVFNAEQYADLTVYNQPDRNSAGFNPNEEHALVAASNRAALKVQYAGENIANAPPLAAFALQADLNVTGSVPGYTSDPWVLVQVNNLITSEPEMAAYQVFKNRPGAIGFPRPSDAVVGLDPGMSYAVAANPEDRVLSLDPDGVFDFEYAFHYPAFAGDLLVPPYPLNVVIGNVSIPARGGNSRSQRSLWWDVNQNPWVVSGGGTFFYQYHYPMRGDFYLPGATIGEAVAWVPDLDSPARVFTGDTSKTNPAKIVYDTFWRSDYPKLKRGETLTYQGGEYFNENPGANGLPAIVAMKAAELVYDVATPRMIFDDANTFDYSARIVRPLDVHRVPFSIAEMQAAGFTPASPSVFTVAERWYFNELPGSISRRFYYDSLSQNLVLRGYLNDKDSGDSDLTAGPDPVNLLEPNLLTSGEFYRIFVLNGQTTPNAWSEAIIDLYRKPYNPMQIRSEAAPHPVRTDLYFAGLKESPFVTKRIGLNLGLIGSDPAAATLAGERLDRQVALLTEEKGSYGILPFDYTGSYDAFYANGSAYLETAHALNHTISPAVPANEPVFAPLDSFGVGAALIPNPDLLLAPATGSRFVTIAENNREELDGAPVSLHIIEIVPDRYRGAIKVVEPADAFSEKITLQHNGEFGGNTDRVYYEWWIRDAAPLDVVAGEVLADGTLKETDASGKTLWQQYIPKEREGLTGNARNVALHSIVFEGRPDVVLADKSVLMRYRHSRESDWTLVPFEFTNPAAEWEPGLQGTQPAPFQWAGAANSPQLQADGSKRYIPQLVMGWVKRVLDRINPYEARYTDFFNNESPATYSSQIQIAGGPFAGKVALNSDKNVIENTGLIELYETVLQRARELSIDNSTSPSVDNDAINQALLLASTRLSTLYEILASEAYSDAQDATINVTTENGMAGVASFTHAFQNLEADLMHEELALLRGTDFRKSYPAYNRLFWNYAKGLGEAAYNVNYNIYDANLDGFINEDDARQLFPQGHGDAWGHYISAIGKSYTLLQHSGFSWRSRPELYSIMQNVIETDYLDEKTFARLAAGKARAGRDIVRGTYRLNYTQNPDGQWQGYTDGADPARAWGVSEWAARAGQGAYFDWIVANAILPEDAGEATPVDSPENLDRIERLGAIDEIVAIVGGVFEIQTAMDEANGGVNPLGFDADALTFDIDPSSDGENLDRKTHFEQIYERAVAAGASAMATLDFASLSGNNLHHIENDTAALTVEAFRQDLDFRNRLIELLGRPYPGTIGFGKLYPEGYEGPDTQLFAYLDQTTIDQIVPTTDAAAESSLVRYDSLLSVAQGFSDDPVLKSLYADVLGNAVENLGTSFGTFVGTGIDVVNFVGDPLGASVTSPFDTTFGVGSEELRAAFVTLQNTRSYEDFKSKTTELMLPVRRNSPYALQALPEWGRRSSYGKIQRVLGEELRERIALDSAINNYTAFLQDFEVLTNRLRSEITLVESRTAIRFQKSVLDKVFAALFTAADAGGAVASTARDVARDGADAAAEFISSNTPTLGFSNSAGDALAPLRSAIKLAAIVPATVSSSAENAFKIAKGVAEFAFKSQITDLEEDIERSKEIAEVEGLLIQLVGLTGNEVPLRNAIGTHLHNLELMRQEYVTAQGEAFRLLREREAYNKVLASKVQKNRYQDMVVRLSRNEAMTKYQSAFNNAARYAWLAARAYDYETSLEPGHPAAPGALMGRIVRERQLGLWSDGRPQVGQGGLAEILGQLDGNFQVLKGQLGLNNPQSETEKISLRGELLRIAPPEAAGGTAASDARWQDALKARFVDDLNQLPEFVRYCRPFAGADGAPQPGLVIRFGTHIEPGVNIFGHPLAPGDHSYSSANYATKIGGFGVWLQNYDNAGLTTTPRAYMVPVGDDYLRTSTSAQPLTRRWGVVEQRIPTPYTINQTDLLSPEFLPTLDGPEGGFSELRRHGDFRVYHDATGTDEGGEQTESDAIDESELILDSRLIGRSVWNSEWLLIIPGANLNADPDAGLQVLAETITDISLFFQTYSHQGQ